MRTQTNTESELRLISLKPHVGTYFHPELFNQHDEKERACGQVPSNDAAIKEMQDTAL